jgi:ferritin
MEVIKCLSELIDEEIDDAAKYIDLAMKWKQTEPDTSDLFYELSLEEMNHMTRLHQEVTEIIEEYRKEHGDPPKEMMWVYNYLHERHIVNASRVKSKQELYKA